ncbi:ATR-interacting protein isoform X2 [Tiliqua scincoides]|uniref:ATR-interacting protein isoform X2 n=1 Tax=Tiliqua scincoides TaxID=71010 RepID=UPI00346323D7
MSANHFFGSKKRNSSILYGVDQAKVTTSSLPGTAGQSNTGNHGDGFPPNKRHKRLPSPEHKNIKDPFGDGDDFTEDDLEEIDIIASQALTQAASFKTHTVQVEQNARWPSPLNNTVIAADRIKQSHIAFTTDKKSSGQFGSSTDEVSSQDKFRIETLQAQYEEAKKKQQEMQDEILIKNGEIKILRDSMQQLESKMEKQQQSYAFLEKEKAQTLSEKEKDFSRKLQSLQSEIQFKDAEMNELRMKLLNCERIKPVTPSVSYTSPKKSPPSFVRAERCSQNEKKSYLTKESFRCEISPKASCSKTQLLGQSSWINEGSILINALMKQPIVPESSLGLCYLLSNNAETWPGPVLQPGSFNKGSTKSFSDNSTSSQEEETLLRVAQKLALTGLNLIAMDEGSLVESSEGNKRGISHFKRYKISGAVHLLPLLEHHIGTYYRALQLTMKTESSPSGNQSACSSRTSSTASVDDFLSSVEEFAVASLGILYYLVFYSWDVVYILLSLNTKLGCDLRRTETPEKDKIVCNKQSSTNLQEHNLALSVANDDQSQHPLFKKLLQLLTLCATAAGCQRHSIMNQCLRVLVKLAEKSSVDLLVSFQLLLNSQTQTLLRCLSSEAPLFVVHLTVRLLTSLAEHHELAAQFCSCSDTCLLLALYMYVTLRPDKYASEMLWLQVEQETVRFLTKCVQCCCPSVLLVGTDCQCNPEVVKALIIMLHRQWLTIRRLEGNLFGVHGNKVVQFLRDTVLLLHNLSQKDKLFQEHCLEVLHQYDHVMPGIRAIFRKVTNLKACEELALDELYPLEPEVDDQEMECS